MGQSFVVHVDMLDITEHCDVLDLEFLHGRPEREAALTQESELIARHVVIGLERAVQVLVAGYVTATG
jgi:hypothetical protein